MTRSMLELKRKNAKYIYMKNISIYTSMSYKNFKLIVRSMNTKVLTLITFKKYNNY
jgi:hypothetical protein